MKENQETSSTDDLIIPKSLKYLSLWVHPEGLVLGSIYLRDHSCDHAGIEIPSEVLNSPQEFIVLKRDKPEELRFYNKSAIIRVEYTDEDERQHPEYSNISCHIHMMDGSLIDGTIKESLPLLHSRLFDYLNTATVRFIRLYLTETEVCLVNKSYVIRITTDN